MASRPILSTHAHGIYEFHLHTTKWLCLLTMAGILGSFLPLTCTEDCLDGNLQGFPC